MIGFNELSACEYKSGVIFHIWVNLSFILIEVYLPLCERSERGIRMKKKLKFTQIYG